MCICCIGLLEQLFVLEVVQTTCYSRKCSDPSVHQECVHNIFVVAGAEMPKRNGRECWRICGVASKTSSVCCGRILSLSRTVVTLVA